ncbi:MAG: DUF1963 domain-containing protein [Boseongicola sp.]|nr:DUF1963 domain-containing protein [Boseongicola sp.]
MAGPQEYRPDLPWPEKDGQPLEFLAQIDLSALPSRTWCGVGPRQGWLAFFQKPNSDTVRVLHFTGDFPQRTDGPSASIKGGMPSRDNRSTPERDNPLPWPVLADELPYSCSNSNHDRNHCEYLDTFRDDTVDLSNPAFQPFDASSLDDLLFFVEAALYRSQEKLAVFLEQKKLKAETRHNFEDFKHKIDTSVAIFEDLKMRLKPHLKEFDQIQVSEIVSQMNDLPFGALTIYGTMKTALRTSNCAQRRCLHITRLSANSGH